MKTARSGHYCRTLDSGSAPPHRWRGDNRIRPPLPGQVRNLENHMTVSDRDVDTVPGAVPDRMRRVVVSQEVIELVDSPTPQPGPGEVLVHAVVSGVCGSDTHAAHGRHPFI